MLSAPSSSTPMAAPARKMPEIITIPEQFYGVALKLKSLTAWERDEIAKTPPPPPPVAKPTDLVRPPEARRTPWIMIAIVAGVIVLSIGGFVFFNRDTLFRKTVAPVVTVEPEPIPIAPSGLSALPTQGAISLAWTDAASNEQGYHIERKDGVEATAVFIRITTLPANSNAFIDVTVQPSVTYAYRVLAGGVSGDSAPSNEITATTPALPIVDAPKPTFPPGGLDSDSDGLTDVEEAVYGTNSQKPDTDSDRFLDGNEVFHLYNPAASAPGKLLESGLVRSQTSASGWTLYIPASWTTTSDPTDASRLSLLTGKGEQFVIAVESNPSRQPLNAWVAARLNQPMETLGEFTTKGGLAGVYSVDRMQAWVAWGDAVFHLTYDLQAQPFVNFRTTLEMMLNSLSLNGAAILPTTLTPANSGPGSLLNMPGSASTTVDIAEATTMSSSEPILTTGATTSEIVPATSSTPFATTTTSTQS